MKESQFKIIFIFTILVIFLLISHTTWIGVGRAYGYYSVPFTYNNPLSGYQTIGIRPFIPKLYSDLYNPFSFGGIHNLLSSNIGGLFGAGVYGGLYGAGGLYALGGLYGLGGIYGLGGFSGLLGGIYGLGGLFGLSAFNPLFNMGLGLPITGSGLNLLSLLGGGVPVVAEQAGTWSGTWNLGFLFGTMLMNLTENPLTGALSGTVQLIGNTTFGGLFNIFGTGSATFVQLNGQDPTLSYAITISGTLPTAATMDGFYSIYKVGAVSPLESGTFSLSLISAVVI